MLATTLLAAVAVTATAVARTAAGESPAGTRVTHITVEHGDGDATVVAVSFDGPITGHRWSHIDGDAPRAVVKIAGIVEAYRPYEVAVDDARVRRIRIGHHPEFDPPEEHLVFDLVDDRVAITRVVKQDRGLIVVLRRVEATGGSRPPAPGAPTPTPFEPKTAPATPTPTMPPAPTATPTPTLRAVPTATATSAPPVSPTSAPPTATPTLTMPQKPARTTPTALPTSPPRVPTPDRQIATIPQPLKDFSGPLLNELVISHREDGSALVRVTADRPIEGTGVRFYGLRVGPPRYLLVIPGAGLPGEDALLAVRDGMLCEIEVVFTEEGGPARTELTFHLASSDVTFEQAAVKGAHAVILFLPPADPQPTLSCEVESRTQSRTWRVLAAGPPRETSAGAR